eukprot:2672735-Prorocentrum_lima.AAC.1
MSTCTIRQHRGAIFEQKPIVLCGVCHVVQMTHDMLMSVFKMIDKDVSHNLNPVDQCTTNMTAM